MCRRRSAYAAPPSLARYTNRPSGRQRMNTKRLVIAALRPGAIGQVEMRGYCAVAIRNQSICDRDHQTTRTAPTDRRRRSVRHRHARASRRADLAGYVNLMAFVDHVQTLSNTRSRHSDEGRRARTPAFSEHRTRFQF